MSVLQALTSRALELRKSRDELAGAFQAVLGNAREIAKQRSVEARKRAGGGELTIDVTEEDALLAVNRSIKQVSDTIETIRSGNGEGSPLFERSVRELAELTALLPAQASDDEVRHEANMFIIANAENIPGMKLMGPTMAHLADKFGASLNKGKASGIVRDLLAAG